MRIFAALIFFVLVVSSNAFAGKTVNAKTYSHYLHGNLLLERRQYSQALKELKKARRTDPKSIYIRLKIASILVRMEDFDAAEKELKAVKKIDPANIDAPLALIFLYAYTHDDTKLEKEYEYFLDRAAQVKPDDPKILEYLGQFYFYKKRFIEALDVYERLVEKNPADFIGVFWIGYIHEEMGQRPEAMQAWEKAIALNPDYAPALNSLGYVYADENINLEKAEQLVKKALKSEPDNGAYLDSLGWVYYKKKEYSKAKDYLLKALTKFKDPIIYEHLGDLSLKMEKIEQATNYYREGLVYFPEDARLKDKLKGLNQKRK